MLGEVGSEVSFLKKKIVHLSEGLALVSGNSISKLVNAFEMKFGKVRVSSTPADQGLQMIDNSPLLAAQDASFYRMAVGVCLYLARDRPDVAFTIKELSSFMSPPTVNSLKHLRRLVGYLKGTDGYTVVLHRPLGGQGVQHKSNDQFWLLESFSDSDWSSDKRHRRSTSAGVHMLCGNFVYASSRTQQVISLSRFQHFVMGYSSDVVQSLLEDAPLNMCCSLTLQVRGSWLLDRASDVSSIWMPRCFGFKIKFEKATFA